MRCGRREHPTRTFRQSASRIADGRRKVLGLQGRVLGQDGRDALACSQVVQHDRNRYPRAAKAHRSVHDLRVCCDVGLPVHGNLDCW